MQPLQGIALLAAAMFGPTSNILATPVAAGAFCAIDATAAGCSSAATRCVICHSGGPPALNPFGRDIKAALAGAPYDSGMADAVTAIADKDSDGHPECDLARRAVTPKDVLALSPRRV